MSGLYSPSSLASQGLLVQGLIWITKAYWILGLWWRCQPFEDSWCLQGRHRLPERTLKWSDSALQYVSCVRGTLGSEPDEYCSCCRGKGESDIWWERPNSSISSWAIRLDMQPPLHPCIRPLCSKEQRLVASCYSRIWLRSRGRKQIRRSIFYQLFSRPNRHLCTPRVKLASRSCREWRNSLCRSRSVVLG